MNNNQIALASLAMDLKRIALGAHRGSTSVVKTFQKEVFKRREEIDEKAVAPYLRVLLKKLDALFVEEDHLKLAEDALMYSTLFQNAVLNS